MIAQIRNYLRTWRTKFHFNNEVKIGDILQLLGPALTIVTIIVGVHNINRQLEMNSMISWRNYLDSRSTEMNKRALDDPQIACIYDWEVNKIDKIDESCTDSLHKDTILFSKLHFYAAAAASLLRDAKSYSDKYDKTFYDTWYGPWAYDLRVDPHGIMRYALASEFGCFKTLDDKACGDEVKDLGMCPDSSDGEYENCVQWIREGQELAYSFIRK